MNYSISVTQAELELIGTALGKLPFESVAALMTKLKGQALAAEEAAKRADASAAPAEGEDGAKPKKARAAKT